MYKKKITPEKIIYAFLFCAYDKSAGATSLSDIAEYLSIKKASLYNHFESKEQMYNGTIDFCRKLISETSFFSEKLLSPEICAKKTLSETFIALTSEIIKTYEEEPIIYVYSFLQTEKFFNSTAAQVTELEAAKIKNAAAQILINYNEVHRLNFSAFDVDKMSQYYCNSLFSSISRYVIKKKETIKAFPESRIGSLFSLPTDDEEMDFILQLVRHYFHNVEKGFNP